MKARYGTVGIVWLLLAGPAFAQNPYYDHGSFPSGGSLGSSAAMRAELDLIEAGFAKLPTLSGNANKIVTVNSGATALTATDAPIPSGSAFPASPSTNALFFITDDTAAGACDSSGGAFVTLCRWDGAAWVAVVGTGAAPATTLDNAYDNGRIINGATLAAPVEIGNGTQAIEVGGDATLGGFVRPKPLGDSVFRCWTNFNCVIRDEEAAAAIFTIDPDAASKLLMYQYGTNYRPLKSVWIGAGNLYGDGTNCPSRPTAVTINSGPVIPTFICADSNSSRLVGALRMPGDWDGGTITLTHSYIQTAADTSALNGDVAAQCRGAGETVSSTWGSEIAVDDAAVTGSNANDLTTSAAITPAGTCAAGDMLYFYYELDATGTTTATATLHHLGFHLTYTSTSWSH